MPDMGELKELMLRTPRLTLAVAESVTCGRVQSRIGEISGASEFFLGGITAYTVAQKVRHLGVEYAAAAACDGVAAEVAAQMACGAAALFGADVAVATTGYAEMAAGGGKPAAGSRPEGASKPHEPFGFWAVAWRGDAHQWQTRTGKVVALGAARVMAQEIIAAVALAEMLAQLRAMRDSQKG